VARQFSRALSQTAARLNVTMNETADAAEKAVSQEFTFRGIEFFFPPDDKTTLLARPGSKTQKELTEESCKRLAIHCARAARMD
jgi:hypothetical protein